MSTLGGFCFVNEAVKFDYCFLESIESMIECCDKVSVLAISNHTDNTYDLLNDLFDTFPDKLTIHWISVSAWQDMKGKTKLANFQNIAAMCLDTDYQLLVQADEVVHPDSYSAIREAIETGAEGFLCERVNLWGDPNYMLVVPVERQPCSISVVRLTKRGYWCYDDGESIGVPHPSTAFYNKIKIVHYGFVRKREVMKAKIINMQQGIFGMADYDKKLDQCEVFDPTLWFSGDDLAPINFTHPAIMQKWALDRM